MPGSFPSKTSSGNAANKLEDVRSSAVSFLAVGIIGMILIGLILAGIIPFPFSPASKAMMLGVMSLLFLAFIGVGLHSASRIRGLRKDVQEEEARTSRILSWFTDTYAKEDIEEGLILQEVKELDYYTRTNRIRELILQEQDVPEEALDTLSETLYEHYYEE